MARVLVVMMPAEGHVNPSLGLVKQLVDSGEEVIYACTEEFRTRVEQTGAKFITFHFDRQAFSDDPDLKPIEFKHPNQFIYMILRGLVERMVPHVLDAVEQGEYDYMIYDSLMGWGGQVVSERLGIPAACSIASFAFAEPLGLSKGSYEDTEEMKQLYSVIEELSQQLATKFQVATPPVDEIVKHFGQIKIVYTSRYFQPQVDKLDDSFVFTGPSIVPRADAPTFSFETSHEQYKHTVYISMGTILNRDLNFYKLCFSAFQELPIQFILSSGKDTDLTSVADLIPDNFIVRPYIPQLEVLQQVDAFITHAGMNSTSEALYFNVPLVTIPLTSDQPMVARRVQELGAGVVVDKRELTPESLKAALLEVLHDPSYRQQAHVIGETLRQAGGYKQAAIEVMNRMGGSRLRTVSSTQE
ncbi:glycosyl transferase [Paenibacillus sp. ACRRX]|uniref:macrolide family glycosyltransferase n=1 Tax=unclassified Paenibacillus TaxID=185978 RepID=UPI001EF4DB2E|nr:MULTISPECIES: macrolide family glycosyltransferase [unclassified Paenibacillus]MCG7408749.1 glycosyl transferase [Paenibacillus sp. ACRRX]MDK8183518.1 glycosyltransferase [Paenibacillus sp. UMB4589-SE434]